MDTLAFTVVASVVVALLYLYVGKVVRSRPVSNEARIARDLFAVWWLLLGILSFAGALQTVLYLGGRLPGWLYLAFSQLVLLVLFGALWALQCYLVYLYRGTNRYLWPLAAFYIALYVATVGLLHWVGPPEQILDDGWRLRTEPEIQFGQSISVVLLLVLLGPQIVGAIAYARLYGKTRDRTQRYRIALLTTSILVWFGTSAVVGAASDPDDVNVAWQVASRLLSILAALTILMAYKPPAWVQRRLGVDALPARAAP